MRVRNIFINIDNNAFKVYIIRVRNISCTCKWLHKICNRLQLGVDKINPTDSTRPTHTNWMYSINQLRVFGSSGSPVRLLLDNIDSDWLSKFNPMKIEFDRKRHIICIILRIRLDWINFEAQYTYWKKNNLFPWLFHFFSISYHWFWFIHFIFFSTTSLIKISIMKIQFSKDLNTCSEMKNMKQISRWRGCYRETMKMFVSLFLLKLICKLQNMRKKIMFMFMKICFCMFKSLPPLTFICLLVCSKLLW